MPVRLGPFYVTYPQAPFLLRVFSSCLIPSMPKKSKSRKRAVRIEVRESGVHGRGVYAQQSILKCTPIIESTGQRVSCEAAPNDENDPHTFNFGLDTGEVINPEIGGN